MRPSCDGPVGNVSYNLLITHQITLACSEVYFLIGDKSFYQLLQSQFFKLYFLFAQGLLNRNDSLFCGRKTVRAAVMTVASSALWTLSIGNTVSYMLWQWRESYKTTTAGWPLVRWDEHAPIHEMCITQTGFKGTFHL